MKKLSAVIMLMLSVAAMPAFAMDLQEARDKGLVGETRAGYIAKLGGGGEVGMLVDQINIKRRAEYEKISAANGQTAEVVGKLAYGQIVSGLPAGAKYQDSHGKWTTR